MKVFLWTSKTREFLDTETYSFVDLHHVSEEHSYRTTC